MISKFQRLAKDVLPPFIARYIRRYRSAKDLEKTKHYIPDFKRSIEHRQTEADRGVIFQIFVSEDYALDRLKRAREIQSFFDGIQRPLIVDAGANIGAAAIWFACKYPGSKVVAIEPEGANYSLLQRNVAGLNVLAVHGAISDRKGTLELFDPGRGDWGFSTHGEGEAISCVRAYTLRELVELEPDTVPFILKLDVEGAETGLFEDDPETYGRFPIIIVELHDWMLPRKGTSQSFLRWHSSRNRDLVIRGENLISICNELLPHGLQGCA